MTLAEILMDKIETRQAQVAVIGLGYVGLPLAVEKAKAGFKTIGFDVQESKVDSVNRGVNYIGDVVNEDLKTIVDSGYLKATSDYSFIKEADFIAICVPTPLDPYQQPDISYVKSSAEEIAKHLKRGSIVVLESTTYPGTTEELLKPILEKGTGMTCGEDFFLAFSPERVDPGNLLFNTKNTPKVVGGVGETSTKLAAAMYRAVLDSDVFEASSPAVAEMEKILENTYRNINIGLVNELAMLCHEMNIDIWEVIDAAKTKPYGFQAFYPGPGLGGHCIPLDPYYLSWKAREYKFHTQLIETSMTINDKMPIYVVERAMNILNHRKIAMNGSNILVLGVAYKKDIDDYRESPALKVIEELEKKGANVQFYDPHISHYRFKGNTKQGLQELTDDIIKSADLVLITTNHSAIDYDRLQRLATDIFDTKNAMAHVQARDNVELL